MFQGMTKVVSSPHNVRDVIVVEPQLLQVSLALEGVLLESVDAGIGQGDLPQRGQPQERLLRQLLQVTKCDEELTEYYKNDWISLFQGLML